MSAGLNLTEDQRRRIEGAKSVEEKAVVIREAVSELKELDLEDMDAVSGGMQEVVIPPTHEEIDILWDAVEWYAQDNMSAAALMAHSLKLIPWMVSQENSAGYFSSHSIAYERAKMHRMLDQQK